MKIGLFGGSFNPIHNAHVALARTICEQAELDEVWFLVSPQNPLKLQSTLLDEEKRLDMVRIALKNEPRLKASDYEFHLERPSYTWNTLQHLHADFPLHEFSLIIGGDNWALFPHWAHYEDILRTHNIIIYPREEAEIDARSLPENVRLVHTPKINITSTMIRSLIAEGKDFSGFVPGDVEKEITTKGYYITKR